VAQIDLRNATIRLADGGSNYIDVKIGEGDLSWSEKRQVDFVKSRGAMDTVRENEEVPLELSLLAIWEFITGAGGDPPTIEDVLKHRNGAASWLSASSDPLAPFCVNMFVTYTPVCPDISKETLTFAQLHWIDLAHSLKDGTIALKANCNVTEATASRG